MTNYSDGNKTYWGYYQDYLVQIDGKKIPPKNSIDFQQKIVRLYIVWRKPAKTQVAADFQIWSKKLNVRVQYNNLMPIWPAPMA